MNNDLKVAQQLVSGSYKDTRIRNFAMYSSIYKFTNEYITGYFDHLKDKKTVLTITASADQILNSCLAGSKEIDCIDISTFPQYFLDLKKEALKTLSKEHFLNYFIKEDLSGASFSELYYDLVKYNLSKESYDFWEGLYNFFESDEIYFSKLFSSDIYNCNLAIHNNPYLREDNYYELKNRIDDVKINSTVGNIFEISNNLDKKYDLINLSNIVYYLEDDSINMEKYKKFISSLPLNDNGEVISYFYSCNDADKYEDEHFKVETLNNFKHKILVYKTKK